MPTFCGMSAREYRKALAKAEAKAHARAQRRRRLYPVEQIFRRTAAWYPVLLPGGALAVALTIHYLSN